MPLYRPKNRSGGSPLSPPVMEGRAAASSPVEGPGAAPPSPSSAGRRHPLARCELCPLYHQNSFVPDSGPEDALLVVCGMAPAKNEVERKQPFCLVPETMVLMADLSWKPLGDIRVGEKLLAVDEECPHGSGISGHVCRRWRIAEVAKIHHRRTQCCELLTEHGSVVGTPDHRVLSRGQFRAVRWRRIDKLVCHKSRSSYLVGVGSPWKMPEGFDVGWLSGFMDGEGHVLGSKSSSLTKRGGIVGFSQNRGSLAERARKLIHSLGFDLTAREESRYGGSSVCERNHIRGGVTASIRFLGMMRSSRLISDFMRVVQGKEMRSPILSRVRARWDVGERDVVDLTTTSGTYIANGFVVHNCGQSGFLLDIICARAGVPRRTLKITNRISCRPPSDDTEKPIPTTSIDPSLIASLSAGHKSIPKTFPVGEVAALCCHPRLADAVSRAKVVFAMGAFTARGFIGSGHSLLAVRGAIFDSDF